ncbi:uncharacterized protein LOC123015040 [Tribolium madens]|uniref:uncharacterized protein LOC123015040 n=1 Tax=Tribolium madens TaxID=41895 RepID=UPI001CF7579F|nr:uncharacterized protein LOC123015040 [Tribolium madens]
MSLSIRNLCASNRDRASQETRATSTPRNNNSPNLSSSPSVSTISRGEEPMEVESDGDSGENRANRTDNDVISSFCESVEETSVTIGSRGRGVKPLKWENFWSSLKPKNKQSLYYKIMTQPDQLESITLELVDTYKTNKKHAIICILQLFVDLCGYKKLSVEKFYNFERENSDQLVQQMQYDLLEDELKKTGHFLFMKTTSFVKDAEHILGQFLDHLLIQTFKSQVLFDKVFEAHIMEFVKCMCLSNMSNICITGVIIIINMITSFLKLYKQFISLSQDINKNTSIERILAIKKNNIENTIDFLYLIFDKQCLIPDKRGAIVKIRATQEMFQWICFYPEVFILKRRCLGRLMKMILDQHELVRLSALTTAEKLIRCEEISEVLKQRIELCLKFISGRFVDINSQVAAQAVHAFTAAIENYFDKITEEYKNKIIRNIYYKDVFLGKAAGKFLVAYLRHQNPNEEQFLLSLVVVAFSKPQDAEKLPIFLESVFEFADELQDWTMFMKVLLNDEIRLGAKTGLIKILNECVRYVLTGNFSYSRQVHRGSPNDDDHIKVANNVIPNFAQLLFAFQTEKVCLHKLIELLSFIDCSVCRSDDLKDDFTNIFTILKEMFERTTDYILLQNITKVFAVFCAKQYYNRATVVVESLKTSIKSLSDDLKQMSPDCGKTLLIEIRKKSLKASILFSHFDLTTVLAWEDIFQVWEINFLKALKYLVVCCKWHLVWRLRQFMRLPKNDNGGETTNRLLYNDCKDFVYGCLEMLKQGKRNSELFLALETFCDLYIDFETELKRRREYSHFVIKITEPTSLEILFNFVVQHVIENREMALKERQNLLRKVITILYLNVVSFEYFSKILRFYYIHNEEFGFLMNNILSQSKTSSPALPLIIMHTLAEIYEEMLKKRQIVDLLTEESKSLKHLAKKFASTREMKSNNDILKFVSMAINFAFRTEQHYNFLYFARYFAAHLNEGGKSDAYELFKKRVPEGATTNEIFLLFAKTLK